MTAEKCATLTPAEGLPFALTAEDTATDDVEDDDGAVPPALASSATVGNKVDSGLTLLLVRLVGRAESLKLRRMLNVCHVGRHIEDVGAYEETPSRAGREQRIQ